MPKISFTNEKPYKDFEVKEGVFLMKALLEKQIPVASSCLGRGVCSKCKITILAGAENLSSETTAERDLRKRNDISDDCRISCQTQVWGDILIDTDYW